MPITIITPMSKIIKCPKCKYEWEPKDKDNTPKVCPRCKVRLDYGKYDIKNKKR